MKGPWRFLLPADIAADSVLTASWVNLQGPARIRWAQAVACAEPENGVVPAKRAALPQAFTALLCANSV